MVESLSESDFVIRVLLSSMPPVITGLLAESLCFLVQEIRDIRLGDDEYNNGETDTSEDG
jgi:hypothetical protein